MVLGRFIHKYLYLLNDSGVFGPKLGTRGMVQARFSWGYDSAYVFHEEACLESNYNGFQGTMAH